MRFISWNSIGTKLLLIVSGLLGFALLLIAGIAITLGKNINEFRFQNKVKDSLKIASSSLAQPIWTFNEAATLNLAQSFMDSDDPTLCELIVKNRDGFVTVNVRRTPLCKGKLENYSTTMNFEGNELGTIEFRASKNYYESQANSLIALFVFMLLACLLTCGILLFKLLKDNLEVPLQELIKAIKSVQQADYALRMGPQSSRELQLISDAFNESVKAISYRDVELRNYAQNLEKLVEARTQELDEQKMKTIAAGRLAAMGELAAGVSHEINNPLMVIAGKVSVLKRKLSQHQDFNSIWEEDLGKIAVMVARISAIVKSLMAVAGDANGSKAQEFETADIINEMNALVFNRFKEYNVELRKKIPKSSCLALGIKAELSQVLLNLLNNALDAVKNLPEKWIEINLTSTDDKIILQVIDSGSGIPDDLVVKMFNPFFTTKKVGEGTGLGLSLASGYMRNQNGSLNYKLEFGHTCFELQFPKAKHKQQAA
jgi:signal transduction histidine kinase